MERGYTTELESLKAFEQVLDDAVDSAVIYTAYAGGYFWGAGTSEQEAIENALSGHLETSGEALDPDYIELREVRGAVAFNAIEKAYIHGWEALDVLDVIER